MTIVPQVTVQNTKESTRSLAAATTRHLVTCVRNKRPCTVDTLLLEVSCFSANITVLSRIKISRNESLLIKRFFKNKFVRIPSSEIAVKWFQIKSSLCENIRAVLYFFAFVGIGLLTWSVSQEEYSEDLTEDEKVQGRIYRDLVANTTLECYRQIDLEYNLSKR